MSNNSPYQITGETSCIISGISDCSVITIFQMEVQCLVSHPTQPNSTDGIASLLITGGTPPYVVTWSNGSIGPILYSLSAGSYGATVVDYYGDFTANTTCVLTGVTPTTTTTSTTTTSPFPTEYQLCLVTNILTRGSYVETQTNFNPDVIYNGKPSWISDDGEQSIIWNSSLLQWEVSASTPTLYVITNLNPTYPPIYGSWNLIGATGSVIVNEGLCQSFPINTRYRVGNGNGVTPLSITITKNQTICGCDGGIVISANGGAPPYTYSIDDGLTYKNIPIFNNLCSGTYNVIVVDDNGLITSSSIILNSPSQPITYNVGLTTTSKTIGTSSNSVTKQYDTTVTITPSLPDGVSLMFDISHLNMSKSSPSPNSSTSNSNSILIINGTGVTGDITSNNSETPSTIPGCQSNTVYNNSFTEQWNMVTIVNTDSLVLTTITSVSKNESVNCYIGTSDEKYSITNLKLSGCNCCSVITT
jgi:hypothetical protein